jgi:hypothetical protein
MIPHPVYVKCFATTRISNTDSNVAAIAAMLNMVPITAGRIGNRDCAGCGFLFFALFSSPLQILRGQVLRLGPDASRRFCFSDRWRMMSRRASEVLKADGKPKMTPV